jgi:transmembrane sensor
MKSNASPNLVNHEAAEAAAAAWLARQDNAETWSQEDEQALQGWLEQHTAHRVAWLRLRQAWHRADGMRDLPRESQGVDDEPGLAPPRVPFQRRTPRLLAGLVVACLLVISAGLVWKFGNAPPGEEKFATAVGARQELTLADGSHVMLNTRTRGRAVISSGERQFWLDEGEAFFEIRHDPKHPFVVMAGRDRITVLGTKFSVRHEGGRTQVTVVEGRVKLDQAGSSGPDGSMTSTTLARNDSAVSQPGAVLVAAKTQEQTQQDLSWREGRLDFDNMTLSEIAAEFNRYNRRQLVVHDDASSLRLSGKFATSNVDGFVRLIHEGFGVVVRAGDEQIHLSMN